MRRIMAIGVAVVGTAALALPLTQAVASSGATHPPHAERRNAATFNSGQLDASLAIHARRVNIDHYLDAVAYTQALEAAQTANQRSGGGSGGGGGGGTCAGSIPGHIIYRESKCNPMAVNSRSGAAGKYQVLESTWAGYGGYATADQAPEEVQDAWAAEAYAAAGCRPWGGC
jgi:muramidase (phage lysozyme)